MKNTLWILAGFVLSFSAGYFIKSTTVNQSDKIIIDKSETEQMKLGAFSVSLSVKALRLQRDFTSLSALHSLLGVWSRITL